MQLEIAHDAEEIAEAGFLVVPFGRHAERRVACDRRAPGERRPLAEFAAQIDEQFVGQAVRPQAIHERARAADVPAHEQIDARMLGLQLFQPLDHAVVKLLFLGRGRDFERLLDPADRVGGDEFRFRSARFVDGDDRAAVRAGFVRPAALRRAAVVGDARLLVDGLLQMPAAEGHVVNAVAFVAGRIARAVGDADREQAVHIAMKAAGIDRAAFAATRALHAGDRFAGAGQVERFDAADRETRGRSSAASRSAARCRARRPRRRPNRSECRVRRAARIDRAAARSPAARRDRRSARRRPSSTASTSSASAVSNTCSAA